MYGWNFSCGPISVTFHPEVSAKDATTLLTGSMIVVRQVLNDDTNVLFLYRCHLVKTMRQLHMEGDLGQIQQQIQVRFIFQEDKAAIGKVERINLSKLARKLIIIVRSNAAFVNLIKTCLNFSIAFKKGHEEKFVLTGTVDLIENMMCSAILTEKSVQSYFRWIQVSEMMKKYKLALFWWNPWMVTISD